MNNMIKKLSSIIGMDGAIAYSSAARIFQSIAGVVNIFFIATFLTGEEQGFFYTFGSILAMQVFFELGFTGIMTQYVAHEVAHLSINNEDYRYEGEQKHISRLADLSRFCIKWYSVISIAFFLIITIVGYIYFNRYDTTNGAVNWQWPWLLLCASTALKLMQSPFSAIYSGIGRIKDMNKIIFYQQMIIPVSQWILFASGVKLYVVGCSSMLGVFVWFFFVFKSDLWVIMKNLLKETVTETVSYMKEIFPYQWKIALSWISGYFIFQFFNPVLFATEGAVVAGQMGMTLSVLNAIQAFSMSWQNTKVPLYSGLIELKKYNELDDVFYKTVKQMSSVCLFLLISMFLFVLGLKELHIEINGSELGYRFLDYLPMLLMMLPLYVNMYVFSWATYLRCHKQEPFLVNSVVVGILCCISTLVLGNNFGVIGITTGYCALTCFVATPWGLSIFRSKKKQWHT